MRNGCVKEMRGSTSDRISHLPSNVIERILTFMPIEDAVRTSVLSKKWRYNWVTIPELEFDDLFMNRESITATRKRRTASRESTTASTNEFLFTICQVLLLHRGPILKFKLCLHRSENCSALNQLIPFVSNNGVRDLIIRRMMGVHYKLPSSLFSCVQLEHLELHYFWFIPPRGFSGFGKLQSLELHHVNTTSKIFSDLISSCPLLKELKLVEPFSLSCLEITAPNLRCFYCKGYFRSICFENAPNLAVVSIDMLYFLKKVNASTWDTIFAGLPAIEFLELKYFCLELIRQSDIPRKLPADMSHLKILNLDTTLDSVSAVSIILCLIRSSPNLEKINICESSFNVEKINICDKTYDDPTMPTLEDVEEQGWLDISSNRLREVHLRMTCYGEFQLEIVKYLLATSPILEKMVIKPAVTSLSSESLMFCKSVSQFRRLSPLAQVFF